MFKKVPSHFSGLDHSGPNKVLPPTFPGVRSVVERYGRTAAASMFPHTEEVDSPDFAREALHDLVDELVDADKVERIDLVRQFDKLVKGLDKDFKASVSPAPPAGGSIPGGSIPGGGSAPAGSGASAEPQAEPRPSGSAGTAAAAAAQQ